MEVIKQIAALGQSDTFNGLPRIVTAAELCAKPPPELIHGILHQRQEDGAWPQLKELQDMKSFLNSLSVQLAGNGCDSRGRQVGFIISTLNSLNFPFQHRISDICEANGINIPRELCLWNLRGYATDRELLLARISRQASKEDFGLIVLDPLYNLSRVRDENASRDMADLMNAIECVAVETGGGIRLQPALFKRQPGREGKYGPH